MFQQYKKSDGARISKLCFWWMSLVSCIAHPSVLPAESEFRDAYLEYHAQHMQEQFTSYQKLGQALAMRDFTSLSKPNQALAEDRLDNAFKEPSRFWLKSRQPKPWTTPTSNEPRYKLGQNLYKEYSGFIRELEESYGVDRHVIMGIWGIETDYGRNTGSLPVHSALASYGIKRPDRRNFVNQQLRAADRLVSRGIVERSKMKGSYAGAMGLTQFIPTSIEKFAVDGDGDNKIDLWTPKDALASTANYLQKHGWKRGQPWGIEVNLPKGFYTRTGSSGRRPVEYWKKMNITPKRAGDKIPETGNAAIVRFKGHDFMIFNNFDVILTYNQSYDYAFKVSALGDHVVYPERPGVAEINAKLNGPDLGGVRNVPRGRKSSGARSKAGGGNCGSEVCRIQKVLKRMGYYGGAIDGKNGAQLSKAIAKYQIKNGMPVDGRITKMLSRKLR